MTKIFLLPHGALLLLKLLSLVGLGHILTIEVVTRGDIVYDSVRSNHFNFFFQRNENLKC